MEFPFLYFRGGGLGEVQPPILSNNWNIEILFISDFTKDRDTNGEILIYIVLS